MSSLIGITKKVEKVAREFEWLQELSDKLREIGSLDQAEGEIRSRHAKESTKLKALLEQVKSAQEAMEVAEERQAAAEDRANEKLKEMQEMVSATSAKAEARAAELIKGAETEAQQAKLKMEAERQSLKDRLEHERLELSRVKKEVEEATDTLKSIEDKISSAKERAMKAYQETFRTEIQ